jgi:hypothetical protein
MLAINARLTFGLLLLPFACVHVMPFIKAKDYSFRAVKRLVFDRKVWVSAIIFVIVFVLTSPQLLIAPMEYFRYWRSFFQLGKYGGFGRFVMDRASAPIFYGEATIWAMGLLQTIALALAGLWALRRRRFSDLLILSFLIPYMLVAAKSDVYFARYAIPVTLLGAVLIARFITEILRRRYVPLAAAILVVQPLVISLQFDRLMLQPDSRTIAHDWILANIPRDAKIVAEFHTPFIDNIYDVTLAEIHGSWQNSLESYIVQDYDYLIVSSFIRDLPMILPEEQERKVRFYQALDQKAELVKEFRPYSGPTAPLYRVDQILAPLNNLSEFDRPGPTIYLYRLPRIQNE